MIWEGEWPGWHGIDEMVPRKRLMMGWEDDTWARGGVRLLLPAGWSWLDDLGDGVNCFVFFGFFPLIFWKSMVIDGWETCFVCCRGQWRPPCWEVNSTVLSGTLFLLRHRSNCGDYWCSRIVRKGGRQVQKYSWIVG